MSVRIERLTGAALRRVLPELARLRIAVFRDFPYLYQGSPDYEERYLATYALAPDSVIVAAFDGDAVVGAATALPMAMETADIRQPVEDFGFPAERTFYFGESVLLAPYRGRGVGVAFFDHREDHARSLGRFDRACFCAVQRAADDPRRPTGHVPLDAFWRHRGFEPVPGLVCYMSWMDLEDTKETVKPMLFWRKDLTP